MLSGESAEITTEEEDLLARSKNEIKVHSGKQSMEDEKPSQTQEMSKMTEGPSYKDSLIGEAFFFFFFFFFLGLLKPTRS
jgi:hypothetical protein